MDDTDRDARLERQAVTIELRRAKRGIDAMRTYYWTNAVLGLLVFAIASGWFSWVGLGFACVAAVGALQMRKRPFLWSTVLAVFMTLLVGGMVVLAVLADLLLDPRVGLAVLWCAGCWWAARSMYRAERLMRENPDAFATRAIRGEPRRKRVR